MFTHSARAINAACIFQRTIHVVNTCKYRGSTLREQYGFASKHFHTTKQIEKTDIPRFLTTDEKEPRHKHHSIRTRNASFSILQPVTNQRTSFSFITQSENQRQTSSIDNLEILQLYHRDKTIHNPE